MARGSYEDKNGKNGYGKPVTQSRRARLTAETRGQQPDWTRIDAALLHYIIGVVTPNDGAVRFGYSKDGGAYAIGIYGDGDPYTLYEHSDEAILAILRKIAEEYSSAQS